MMSFLAKDKACLEKDTFIPAEEIAPYEGKQITEIRAGLTAAATNLYPIISTKYGANEISQDGVNGKSGWNTIKLDQPYTIGKGDLYVGYGCTGGYVIGFGDVFHPNGNHQPDDGRDHQRQALHACEGHLRVNPRARCLWRSDVL